jgi:hypothetical protein
VIKHWIRTKFPPGHAIRAFRVSKNIVKNPNEADLLIHSRILECKPTLISRMGATEAAALSCWYDLKANGSKFDPFSKLYSFVTHKKRFQQLRDLAGVYPIDEIQLSNFYLESINSILNSDILGCWGEAFTSIENLSLSNKNVALVHHLATSPWVLDDLFTPGHWSSALSMKRVLVISPFAKTFEAQYKNLDKVFAGVSIPNFELVSMVAVLSQGGLEDGKNWSEHLEEMQREMSRIDFDIALVSAGSYTNPLALYAKKMGKVGISCGGELQLFFGVMGKRWETPGRQTQYVNEWWVRPPEESRPKNWKEIEDGCYW